MYYTKELKYISLEYSKKDLVYLDELTGLLERGYHDEAFESLDKALFHARELERIIGKTEHRYTAPLVSFVADTLKPAPEGCADVAGYLPDDWPFWCNPDFKQVEKEIKADPRWDAWVKRTKK